MNKYIFNLLIGICIYVYCNCQCFKLGVDGFLDLLLCHGLEKLFLGFVWHMHALWRWDWSNSILNYITIFCFVCFLIIKISNQYVAHVISVSNETTGKNMKRGYWGRGKASWTEMLIWIPICESVQSSLLDW